MKSLLLTLAAVSATAIFTGCVAEESTYQHRNHSGYYNEGPRYRQDRVVIYDNDRGYDGRDRRDYRDSDVNRTNVHERNVYRTNVYENDNDRRISANRTRVTYQAQPPVKETEKGKKKHKDQDKDRDHDKDHDQDHQ